MGAHLRNEVGDLGGRGGGLLAVPPLVQVALPGAVGGACEGQNREMKRLFPTDYP